MEKVPSFSTLVHPLLLREAETTGVCRLACLGIDGPDALIEATSQQLTSQSRSDSHLGRNGAVQPE
jgi:hypothetical protein